MEKITNPGKCLQLGLFNLTQIMIINFFQPIAFIKISFEART